MQPSTEYQKRPLPDELNEIKLPAKLVTKLNESYAWVDVEGKIPFTSLISPVGKDEAAMRHFVDNATVNHHSLMPYMNELVNAAELQQRFADGEVSADDEQYLGAFLLQYSDQNALFLPLLDSLALAKYDVIGVFASMLQDHPGSVLTVLIDVSARLLARLAPEMRTLDHTPMDADYSLPSQLIINVEDAAGNGMEIPVGLLDWLPAHLDAVRNLDDEDENGLLNYLNSQEDDGSWVIRDWLMRDEDNQHEFSKWIFQHRQHAK